MCREVMIIAKDSISDATTPLTRAGNHCPVARLTASPNCERQQRMIGNPVSLMLEVCNYVYDGQVQLPAIRVYRWVKLPTFEPPAAFSCRCS